MSLWDTRILVALLALTTVSIFCENSLAVIGFSLMGIAWAIASSKR